MKFYHFLCVIALFILSVFTAKAQNQQPQTPEQQEKQLMEYVDKEVQRLSNLLNLEYWQEFYVDSTLTHDLKAMTEEMAKLRGAKVENTDLYQGVQDKWMQQIDDNYKRYFTEEQWKKYWKSGGERAWKAREKRKKK
jgi:hypothetical protein